MSLKQVLRNRFSNEDTYSVVKNVVLSFGVKGFSLLVALFTTPAYIRYFDNDEVLGLWFTLLAVLSWILSCDMGIGNGLRNKLVSFISSNDEASAKKYISSSYCFSACISVVVICAVALLTRVVDWNIVFNIDSAKVPPTELALAIGVILLAICLQLVLRLITSILYALQEAFVPGLLNLAANCLLLFYAIAAPQFGFTRGLVPMGFAYLIAVNAPLAISTIIVFSGRLSKMRPAIRCFDFACAVDTLKLGLVFLWLQLMALLLNSTNSYLVTLFVGNEAVVQYQLYYKIFIIASTLIALASTPIWSASTKAKSEGHYDWLFRLYKRFLLIGAVAVAFEFALCFPLQLLFDFWLGDRSIGVDYAYALFFAGYGSCAVWSSVVTCFANGLGELKVQTIFLTFGAIVNIPLAYMFSCIECSSLAIVWANTIAYLPYLIIQTIWMYRHLNSKVRARTCA